MGTSEAKKVVDLASGLSDGLIGVYSACSGIPPIWEGAAGAVIQCLFQVPDSVSLLSAATPRDLFILVCFSLMPRPTLLLSSEE